MSLDLSSSGKSADAAVWRFWDSRVQAAAKQEASGALDQGGRANVTAGKNMDGFIDMLVDLARVNGLLDATICTNRSQLTLPGFFRPTKNWDLPISAPFAFSTNPYAGVRGTRM